VRGQDPQRHALPEAGIQAQRALFSARRQIYRTKDRGWPSAAYSGSDHAREVHQREAGGRKALCRAGTADARRIEGAGGMVRGPRSFGQELAERLGTLRL